MRRLGGRKCTVDRRGEEIGEAAAQGFLDAVEERLHPVAHRDELRVTRSKRRCESDSPWPATLGSAASSAATPARTSRCSASGGNTSWNERVSGRRVSDVAAPQRTTRPSGQTASSCRSRSSPAWRCRSSMSSLSTPQSNRCTDATRSRSSASWQRSCAWKGRCTVRWWKFRHRRAGGRGLCCLVHSAARPRSSIALAIKLSHRTAPQDEHAPRARQSHDHGANAESAGARPPPPGAPSSRSREEGCSFVRETVARGVGNPDVAP